MCRSVCNQQICENLFSVNLPSLHLITILRIYMIQPYLHGGSKAVLVLPII